MAESAEGPISIPVPQEAKAMNVERPQPTIEEAQVMSATERARQAMAEGVKFSGGSGSLGGDDLGPDVNAEIEDMMRIRRELGMAAGAEFMIPTEERYRESGETLLRYYEGRLVPEAFRTGRKPGLVRQAAREYMADNEETIMMPEPGRITATRDELRDRVRIFEKALHPERWPDWKEYLEERGLIDRELQAPIYSVLPGEMYELRLSEEDKDKLLKLLPQATVENPALVRNLQNGNFRVVLTADEFKSLYKSEVGQNILEKRRTISRPAVVPRDRLPELMRVCEAMRDEIWARERVFIASVLYNQNQGAVDNLCKLFEDQRYSTLSSQEWKTIFNSEATFEGDMRFGDKVDLAMRLYTLIGLGEGPEPEAGRVRVARERIEYAVDPNLNPGLRDTLLRQVGGRNRWDEILPRLSEYAARNIFADNPAYEDAKREEWITEVKNFVREVIGGMPEDTKAAEELGWRIFYMWGMATYFDNRRTKGTPNGWPASDDTMKLQHFEAWRRREIDHNYGPHATLNKYDEMARQHNALNGKFTMVMPFLHWLLPMEGLEVKYMRTFWERWWGEGTLAKDLPWNSVRNYSFWYYNLMLYFAGGYGAEHDRNLFGLLMQDKWRRDDLIELHNLQDIKRTVEYAIGGWSLHQGEIHKWLNSLTEREKDRAEKCTADQFSDQFVEPVHQRIKELILMGAITSAYETSVLRTDASKEWGLWRQGLKLGFDTTRVAKWVEQNIPHVMQRADFLDENTWQKVVRESENYLKSKRVI